MVKLVALYKHPQDPAAFDRHYAQVHTPLVRKLPGLRRMEVARVAGAPQGDSPYHLVAAMYFSDRQSLDRALSSPEGRAAGKDLMGFARDVVSLHIAELTEKWEPLA